MAQDPAEAIALFRYGVIAEAANPRLSSSERGLIVRSLASRAWPCPDGAEARFSRGTIDRWLRAYRAKGLAGLRPQKRSDAGAVRRHPELLAEAAALRTERPARSSAHISDIIKARHGIQVSERTIRAHLAAKGLTRRELVADKAVFGRYQAERVNQRWIGDVLVGPWVPFPRVAGSRRAKLFLFVDDYSRLLVHGLWVLEENTRSGQKVLKAAIVRRGIPESIYLDNGAPFSSAPLARTCAVLGIHLVHSRPYRPQGRGKQERLNRVIRERFLLEAETVGISSLEELNERFMAWVESVLNNRIHAETGEAPIARFLAAGPPKGADSAKLAEAFRWSASRMVTKTATVSLEANRYQVDPALVGKKVELRYDPEDLSVLDVFFDGKPMGVATALVISAHTHSAVPQAARKAPEPTGIDYLGAVLKAHDEATIGRIAFRDMPAPGRDETGSATN